MTNLIQGAVVRAGPELRLASGQQGHGPDRAPAAVRLGRLSQRPEHHHRRWRPAGHASTTRRQNYIPNLPSFLQAQCADLTPYIGGDAVKDYPNLANIPTPCWAETVFNGAIYAVPVPRAPFLNAFLVRQDLVDQAQLEAPTIGRRLQEVPGGAHQRAAEPLRPRRRACAAFGLRQPVAAADDLWRAEQLARSTRAANSSRTSRPTRIQSRGRLRARPVGGRRVPPGYAARSVARRCRRRCAAVRRRSPRTRSARSSPSGRSWRPRTRTARLRVIHPFSADGKAKPIYHTGPSNFGMSFVKKGSADASKLLLRVLNYIAVAIRQSGVGAAELRRGGRALHP